MTPVPAWRRYLRFLRPDVDGDIDEELRFHLDERAEELVASHIPRDQAEQQARAELGDSAALRDGLRVIRHRIAARRSGTELLQSVVGDIRYGLRQIGRAPMFATVIVLVLAVEMGGIDLRGG